MDASKTDTTEASLPSLNVFILYLCPYSLFINEQYLVASGSRDRSVRLWDALKVYFAATPELSLINLFCNIRETVYACLWHMRIGCDVSLFIHQGSIS